MEIPGRDEPAVELQTGHQPDASVIWLHGLGADGHDFEVLVPELRLTSPPALRFVFPHAPYRPVTINGGHVMRAWYDIAMSEHGFDANLAHIRESEKILRDLIEKERQRGIASERIVLAGFSQGGAIALATGLGYHRRLAGILSLSAPIPFVDILAKEIHDANRGVPLFLAHGTDDSMVPFDTARLAWQRLQAHGLEPALHTYAMGHTVVPEEIRDIARWLAGVVAPTHG